ncbi:Uncharacterised protein at_DN2253 [Pycnogonum litorale]
MTSTLIVTWILLLLVPQLALCDCNFGFKFDVSADDSGVSAGCVPNWPILIGLAAGAVAVVVILCVICCCCCCCRNSSTPGTIVLHSGMMSTATPVDRANLIT